MTPQEEKILHGLQRWKPYLGNRGPAFVKIYPPDKIPENVYDQITVPVPLPCAMLLFALALSILKGESTPYPPITPAAEVTP